MVLSVDRPHLGAQGAPNTVGRAQEGGRSMGVTCLLGLGLGVLVAGDFDRASALVRVMALWTFLLAIDFGISFSYTLWPRRAKT